MMELLLNLAWLLLALPAYWLWRQDSSARVARSVSSRQCVFALGCVLVLLFPVISASDDLHAMRAEMEESATSKRASRHASADRTSAWTNRLQSPPASIASGEFPPLLPDGSDRLELPAVPAPSLTAHQNLRLGRAPPIAFLG